MPDAGKNIYSIHEKEMRTKAPKGRQDNSPGQARRRPGLAG